MECDQTYPHIQVVDSLHSHDFLDTELPLEESILEFMASIENPKDEVMHQSSFFYSKQMRVSMMILDSRLGEFFGASSIPPSLDPFPPRLFF
jgi:hypothetical protein